MNRQPKYLYRIAGTSGADGLVNLTYEEVKKVLVTTLRGAGFKEATAYSFRKSSAKWWTICGAEWWQIRNSGRWKAKGMATVYVEQGRFGDDPEEERDLAIRKLWVWKPNTAHDGIAPEFENSGANGR